MTASGGRADEGSSQLPYLELYRKYREELSHLARLMRDQFHELERRGSGTAFSDVEGEVLYMLLRETKPEVVFEISPWHGWSTNYILAALTENDHGALHSFELIGQVNGDPIEQVIRRNQHPAWDQERLTVHVGDARATTREIPGSIDFLLLDSCHDDWFADWYIENLFPRVNGTVFLQDIAFVDRLEPSSEARRVWEWMAKRRVRPDLVGLLEPEVDASGIRAGFAERRYRQSNAIVFTLPEPAPGEPPRLRRSIDDLLSEANTAAQQENAARVITLLDQVVFELLRAPTRVNRHRQMTAAGFLYLRLGQQGEAHRCFRRAQSFVLGGDAAERAKGFVELLRTFGESRQWRHVLRVAFLLMQEPGGARRVVRPLASILRPR